MSAERALGALWAIDCLGKLMDLYDEFDKEPKVKKRKAYVKAEDVECRLLKDIAWRDKDGEDPLFCPISMDNFEELYNMVSPKFDTRYVPIVNLRVRLAITLRFLIAGESYRVLQKIALVSRKTIQKIVPQMLRYLVDILEEECLKIPKTASEWENQANDFEQFWGFPHTLGAVDIRNFHIRSSVNDRSLILLCVLDAHSRFQHIELIQSETYKYPTAYVNSRLYKSLISKKLKIPAGKPLMGQTAETSYFFVGSKGFGLDRYILNTYDQTSTITKSQKAFNFRLNRVRLPVQMAFEIIFFRFKILYRLVEFDIEKAKLVLKTCCLLHNYLTQKLTQPLDYSEDIAKLDLPGSDAPLPKQISGICENGYTTRDNVCKYCVDKGNIQEQWS